MCATCSVLCVRQGLVADVGLRQEFIGVHRIDRGYKIEAQCQKHFSYGAHFVATMVGLPRLLPILNILKQFCRVPEVSKNAACGIGFGMD
jgi:hypothetical protein